MSVVTGLIINDGIIISADTLLAHLSDSNKNKHGFSKIYRFTLAVHTFLIGAGGVGEDLEKFLDKIQKHPFDTSIVNNPLSFANELQNILTSNNLTNLTLLVGGIKNGNKLISRVRHNEKQTINKNGSYLIFLPDSVKKSTAKIQEVIELNKKLLPDKPLKFLKNLQLEVAKIDKLRYVNKDFYYVKLKKNGSIEAPEYSDKGHKMN